MQTLAGSSNLDERYNALICDAIYLATLRRDGVKMEG